MLDPYKEQTCADGQAAAVCEQRPLLVNASRPPGPRQTYDINLHDRRVRCWNICVWELRRSGLLIGASSVRTHWQNLQ